MIQPCPYGQFCAADAYLSREPMQYRSADLARARSTGRSPSATRPSGVGPQQSRRGRMTRAETTRLVPGLRGRLPGRQAERFGMDPAVVLGQDLAEAARPVRDGAAADLAARDRKTGNGYGETAGTGLAHRFHDASPARLTVRPPRAGRAADSGPVDGAGPGSYRPTPRRRLSFVERPGRPWLPARRPMRRCRASQLRRRSREISSPSQRHVSA
jgi:hypothetical protein